MSALDRLLALVGLDFDLGLRDVPFHRITPELHLGACPTPDHVGALREVGIPHVVSCLEEEHRVDMAFLDLHGLCRVPVEREVLEEALASHGYLALPAIRSILDGEAPRLVQGGRR